MGTRLARTRRLSQGDRRRARDASRKASVDPPDPRRGPRGRAVPCVLRQVWVRGSHVRGDCHKVIVDGPAMPAGKPPSTRLTRAEVLEDARFLAFFVKYGYAARTYAETVTR